MNLQAELYLAAGLGSLGLGLGTLLREPGRRRNRLCALFCGALALWNLGEVGSLTAAGGPGRWPLVFLLGACFVPPLGLHFALAVAGHRPERDTRTMLAVSYAASAALWGSAWFYHHLQPAWNLAAFGVLGGILSAGLKTLHAHLRSVPRGLHRGAVRVIVGGAAIGIAAGMSDLIPRGSSGVLKIGPAGILLFILSVCVVLIRHRFLDVDIFVARLLALLAGASAASAAIYVVARFSGERILPIFAATLLIIILAGPAWRALLSGARTLISPDDPLARALMKLSRRISLAREQSELESAVEEGRRLFPEGAKADVYFQGRPGGPFRPVFLRPGAEAGSPAFPASSAIARLLEMERVPVTRLFLEVEARESQGARCDLAARALEETHTLGAELLIPLVHGRVVAGWLGIGGGNPDRYLTAELAAALLALGNQAMASLERIEAVETAKKREALAAVGEMAAGLAHEIRNPVGAIRGAAQVLAGAPREERAKEMLEVIEEETGRLGRVVGEFLDYARPASPRPVPVDLGEVVRRVVRAADAAGMGMRTEVQVSDGAPLALADPDQIQRAFTNLARNAREAAGADGILRVEIAPDGTGQVAVRFEDNGPGIPPERMPRLFQPFHTTKRGGTGLGLALVHRVVEAHGGEVRVEGRLGLGASFTVALPAAKEPR